PRPAQGPNWGGFRMCCRWLSAAVCVVIVAVAAWMSGAEDKDKPKTPEWTEVVRNILRSPGTPAGYALVDGEAALLIDAPLPPDGLKAHGIKKIDAVLLTHHHRDTCAAVGKYLADKIPVRAPKASAEWLTPANVRKYWKDS